jgi:uncharacterized protein
MIKRILLPAFCMAAFVLGAVSLSFGAVAATIVDAARAGDTAQVRAFLERKADVNAPALDGATALHWAVNRDDLNMVDLLLGAGAKVDVANDFGTTPLFLACENGSAAMVDRLLKAGANPNAASPRGEIPLMIASRTGNIDTVRALLDHGASVDAKEETKGQTALMWAIDEQHSDVVKLLMDRGADVHAKSKSGFSPFLFALRNGDEALVKTLLASGGINLNDKVPGSQGNALLITIANANLALTTLLLDSGADPNVGNGVALLSATSSSNYDIAALLLNHGANPNLGGPNGAALHALIRNDGGDSVDNAGATGGKVDRMTLAAMLVAKGADVNGRGGSPPRGKTVSIGTALKGLPKLENPDPSGGVTVFLSAAENADVPMLRFLLKNGVNPKLTSGGDNALMLAAGVGNNPSSNKESAVLEAVKICYEAGLDINAKDDNGDTAMHGAVLRGANSVIRFLAEHGALLNEKNRIGWTPLDMAQGLIPGTPNYRPDHSAALLRELLGLKK